jgi:hypothetical protein
MQRTVIDAMRDDHITGLASRYEFDEAEQLLLVVDQLEVCADMLRRDAVSSSRAAIILLDHHAEILLHRHCESLFRAGEGHGPFKGRTYTTTERGEVRNHFAQKLAVASGVGRLGAGVAPVVNADRSAALRLAHTHRNAAYHRDDHNPAVIRLVCLLQFEAVCCLLAATTSSLTIGGVTQNARLAELARHGVHPTDSHGIRNAICLRDAADKVVESLTADLKLPLPAVQARLAMDLLDRAGELSGVVAELVDAGMEPYRIVFAIENSEFWERHGSDEQLCELARRSDPWERRHEAGPGGSLPDEVYADMNAANDARNERWTALRRKFRPRAQLQVVSRTIVRASKLIETSSMAETLNLYQQLDRDLAPLETFLPEAVRAWDAMVQRKIDIARGK